MECHLDMNTKFWVCVIDGEMIVIVDSQVLSMKWIVSVM